MRKFALVLLLGGLFSALNSNAQVTVNVHEDAEGQPKIHKEIYGQFAEHFGRCI